MASGGICGADIKHYTLLKLLPDAVYNYSRPAAGTASVVPSPKPPVGGERVIPLGLDSRLRLTFPRGNGAVVVASDRIVFTAIEMLGNIYLVRPLKSADGTGAECRR